MPTFSTNAGPKDSGLMVVAALVLLAVLVIVGYLVWPNNKSCPSTIHRNADGSLTLQPSGKVFSDMNEFQQWWHSSGENAACPIPVLTGYRINEAPPESQEASWGTEQTYAKTPIYKVDDYEFSRIFGYERDGHMEVPRQNFNMLLVERFFDWADRPLTSDERKRKYSGLTEGFTADGTLSSVEEARSRYGEGGMPYPTGSPDSGPRSMTPGREYELCKKAAKICTYDAEHDAWPGDAEKRELCREARAVCKRDDMPWSPNSNGADDDCKITRTEKEVAKLVAKAYESDPDYEPVVTKVGANNWEVTELKPRHRKQPIDDRVEERVVDTDNEHVDIEYMYRDREAIEQAVDPFYLGIGQNNVPINKRDPFYGPVPGLERPFGPTFDHKLWY